MAWIPAGDPGPRGTAGVAVTQFDVGDASRAAEALDTLNNVAMVTAKEVATWRLPFSQVTPLPCLV